jgi:starch synthase (maltosyl-transferring)
MDEPTLPTRRRSRRDAQAAAGPAAEGASTAPEIPEIPRIYRLPGVIAGDERDVAPWLEHAAAMGFTHVLATLPHGELASDTAASAVQGFAARCREHQLALLVDIDVHPMAADARLRQEHPEWFQGVIDSDSLPDPRRAPDESGARWRLHDPAAAAAAAQWWTDRLVELARAGVRGFRVLAPASAPADWWHDLLGQVRAQATGPLLFAAWTQGLAPEQLAPLAQARFDYTFCSFEWWDFRSPWLREELERLRAVAPPLACVAPIDGAAQVARGEQDQREHAGRRALWFAASCAAGWVMPAGFEWDQPGATQGRTPDAMAAQSVVDLVPEVGRVNTWLHSAPAALRQAPVLHLGRDWTALLCRSGDVAQLLLANAALERETPVDIAGIDGGIVRDFGPWRDLRTDAELAPRQLEAGAVMLLHATRAQPANPRASASAQRQRLSDATVAARIAIENVSPCVDGGRFAVKRVVGDRVVVEADVFMDGHDELAAVLRWRALGDKQWQEQRMAPQGNDRYRGEFTPFRIGPHEYVVQAWRDAFATYQHEIHVKHDAGLDIGLELEEGRLLVESTAAGAPPKLRKPLRALLTQLENAADDEARYRQLIADASVQAMAAADPRPFAVESPLLRLEVDRRAAMFASWYELFPRSETDDPARHGTLRDVIKRLPAIQAMGFDVLYFPPIHPIGTAFRKGPNNTLTPGPDDPGSPYAVGSPEGGHDAIHPQLGTLEDFRALRDAAHAHGLELALDFAIQCSPDHPWLREHPEWFDWRPDGSLRYAENPPKKYQDIVNVDFYADGAVPSLWQALCDVVLFWAGEGVRTFRVDNPHTKPYPFWEWMIARVRAKYPDALFLSEAFTRPKPMYRLAKVGFSQSYTYFTWRNSKQEFVDYLTELTTTAPKEFFRPNFFVNTPDINPYFLQTSGRPGFLIRAALATTLSGLWGMYSGFEICESAPVPGKEEYLDSEKYEIRIRDFDAPGNIVAEITRLNHIRRAHPALQTHLGVRFLPANNDQVLFFEKRAGDDLVLVAISMDPHNAQAADLSLPLGDWGLSADAALDVQDLLHDQSLNWRGTTQHVWLGLGQPYAVWQVRLPGV